MREQGEPVEGQAPPLRGHQRGKRAPGRKRLAPLVDGVDIPGPFANRFAVAVAGEEDAGLLVELTDRRHVERPRLVVEHAGHAVADAAQAVAQRRDVAGAVGQRELAARKHVGTGQHGDRRVPLDHEHFQPPGRRTDQGDGGRRRQRGNGHSPGHSIVFRRL